MNWKIESITLTDGIALMSTDVPAVKTTLLLFSTLLIIGPSSAKPLDLRPQIDPLAKQLLADKVAVGFVVGIYKDGETQVIGYGKSRKGTGISPDGDTIYEIGAASMAFTGVLLADQVERGKVKLDDPMQKYLPKAAKTRLRNPTHITFEHLATHTSGLPRLPDNMQPADLRNPYADYTFQQMYAFLTDHELRRDPGEYELSMYGIGLLGVLLASREGVPYEELLVERIAKPCGMDDTCVELSSKQRRRLARPYDAELQVAKNWDYPGLTGGGGIRSTTNDMLKFIAANLADDDKPLTKALQLSHKKRLDLPGGMAIGLGWHLWPDGMTLFHDGISGGYATWLAVLPSHDLGVVILSNTATGQITELGLKITRLAFEAKADSAPPAQVTPELLQSYEGVYAITPQFALTITFEEGNLMVQGTGQPKLELETQSATKFFCNAVDAYLFFVADKSGKAKYVVLHQNGVNKTGTRQD